MALSDNVQLCVRRVEGAPVVAVRLWICAGGRRELIPGQALVTGRMLTEGTAGRDWRRIADDAENKGMILSSFGTFENHGVTIDALAHDWERALEWTAEMLIEPTFPEDRCAWMAKQAAAELESLTDQPDIKTAWGFLAQLYSPHPRSRPLHGSVESLLSLTPADCARFHAASLSGGVLVAVAGVIDEDAVRRRLEELFATLPAAGEVLPQPPAPVGLPGRGAVQTEAEDQAHLYMGHLTVDRRHPDYTALEVAAVILGSGAGLTGRIPMRIREQEGLAYSAHAQTTAGAGLDPGRLLAYVGTSPATVDQAEAGVRAEIARLVDDGIADAELEEARAYLLGREPFRRETARQWADLLIEAVEYGLPLADPEHRRRELEALDRETVEAAIRRHIRPADLRVTVGLPGVPGEVAAEAE
ncbi:MAG TPA: pitrilysin family protein [Thermoanaerobaculia bacterium]|jgi:zinc protease|nr:pitrilysin family protein [Thermoanaerobaculia bacterium]